MTMIQPSRTPHYPCRCGRTVSLRLAFITYFAHLPSCLLATLPNLLGPTLYKSNSSASGSTLYLVDPSKVVVNL